MKQPIIDFQNQKIEEGIQDHLRRMKEFEQDTFFDPDVQDYLIKELKLTCDFMVELRNQIWSHLKNDGYVIVKNLPFDENNRLSVGLASIIGTPIPHNQKVKEAVREITPRGGSMPLENYPHTDTSHWIHQNDVITLQCVREDQEKEVYSRIVPLSEVLKIFTNGKEALIEKLYTKNYPFILAPDFGDQGYQMQPIMTRQEYGGKAYDHIRFCRSDTLDCIRNFDLEVDDLQDLEYFESVVDGIGEEGQFLFRKGDWLIFDNKRTFHSKTQTSYNSVRMLKKMKLQLNRDRIFSVA